MSDPTTPAKSLTQPTVGGDNNTWGGLLNTNLALIDSALGGTVTVSISGNITLTGSQAQNTGFEFSGTLSGTAAITWPAFYGFAVIQNATSGGHSITCGISGGTVTVANGETVAIWSDGTNFVRLAQFGGGILGVPSSVKTSNYTIAMSDASSVIQMGTGSTGLLTVMLPSASGFPANTEITVKNGDTARGKALSGFPVDLNPILWPQQSVTVKVVNGAWVTTYNPGRWRFDGAAQTFYVNHGSGSDATTNDGLSASSPFATIVNAANIIKWQVDCNGNQVAIQVAQETFSESVGLVGRYAYGINNLQIVGDPSAPDNCVWQPGTTGAGDSCLTASDLTVVVVNGFKFVGRGSGQTALQAAQGGILAFENVDFGTFTAGTHMSASGNSTLTYEGGTWTVSGNMNYHIALGGPSQFVPTNGTINVPNPLTFSQWLSMIGSGAFFETTMTYSGSGAGSGSTGAQYLVEINASAQLNGTTLPGATGGGTNNGGVVIP